MGLMRSWAISASITCLGHGHVSDSIFLVIDRLIFWKPGWKIIFNGFHSSLISKYVASLTTIEIRPIRRSAMGKASRMSAAPLGRGNG